MDGFGVLGYGGCLVGLVIGMVDGMVTALRLHTPMFLPLSFVYTLT